MDVDPLLKVRNWGTSVWEQLYLFWIQNTLLKPKQQKWHDLQNFFSDFSSLIVLTWWGCGTPGAADTYWQAKQSDFGSGGSNNSHVQVVEARPWRMTLKGKAVFSQHVQYSRVLEGWGSPESNVEDFWQALCQNFEYNNPKLGLGFGARFGVITDHELNLRELNLWILWGCFQWQALTTLWGGQEQCLVIWETLRVKVFGMSQLK